MYPVVNKKEEAVFPKELASFKMRKRQQRCNMHEEMPLEDTARR